VGFESTIAVLERSKTVHALYRAATVIGGLKSEWENFDNSHFLANVSTDGSFIDPVVYITILDGHFEVTTIMNVHATNLKRHRTIVDSITLLLSTGKINLILCEFIGFILLDHINYFLIP
jgi:hypothetical protein